MKQPLVAVIVPIYNVEKYLEECVESILAQTYCTLDIILVDDGSVDSSSRICDELASKDSRVRVFHKKNGGLVSAWSYGLGKVLGECEYISFVDSDDKLELHHIEYLLNEAIISGADVVVTRMKQWYTNYMEYIEYDIKAGFYSEDHLEKDIYPIMINSGGFEKRGVPFSRCSKLIKKSLLLKNLHYEYENATYEEDFNIMAPVLMDMKSICFVEADDCAYLYRMNDSSMLHGYDGKMIDSVQHIYPLLHTACENKNQLSLMNQINNEFLSSCVRIYANELKNPRGIIQSRNNVIDFYLNNYRNIGYDTTIVKNWPLKFKILFFLFVNIEYLPFQWIFNLLWMIRSK